MAQENLYELSELARQDRQGLRADGYAGKKRYNVLYHGDLECKVAKVFAGDTIAAIWTAMRYWGIDPRNAEEHQRCRTWKL